MPRPRQTPDRTLTRAEIQKAYRDRQKQTREEELKQKGMPASRPIPSMPSTPRWTAMLDAARAQIEAAKDEMQTYFDERSEEWQNSEKGEAMQEQLERLDTAIEALEET